MLDEDPASQKVQALAARWKKLELDFVGGEPEIAQGANNFFADRANWSPEIQEYMAPFGNRKVWDFMRRVFQSGRP